MPFQAIAKAIIGGEYEGFAKVIGHARPTTRSASTHRPARDGPDRGGVGRVRARRDAVGDRRRDARPPDLSEVMGEAAMAVDGRSINF